MLSVSVVCVSRGNNNAILDLDVDWLDFKGRKRDEMVQIVKMCVAG